MMRLLVIVPFTLITACGMQPESTPLNENAETTAPVYADQPIETYRSNLLDLAFTAVSRMPLNPHIKNRSRSQIMVLDTALELNQAAWVKARIGDVANWQRWMGFANLAAFYACNGQPERVKAILKETKAMLEMAEQVESGKIVAVSENPLIETLSDWRYQQVKAKVLDVEQSLAADVTASSYEAAMTELRILAESENFETIHNAQLAMVEQADLHFGDLDLNDWVGKNIEPGFKKMPVFLKVDVLAALVEVCIAYTDFERAMELLERVESMIADASLPPRLHIPEMIRIISLRWQAGDCDGASTRLDVLLQLYDNKRELIVDIERAALLCRLAEGFDVTGQSEQALELYSRAADEGIVNPNSRPRADDLAGICCSMALAGIEPSPDLMHKLDHMNDELGTPW